MGIRSRNVVAPVLCSLLLAGVAPATGFERVLGPAPSVQPASVTIQNVGPSGLQSPRTLAEGEPDFVSLEAVVAEVTRAKMADREKAEALWRFLRDRTVHACPTSEYAGRVSFDPLTVLNELGYGCCDQLAPALAGLWTAAGLRARFAVMAFHTVPEVYFEDSWHMYDPDHGLFYLLEDGRTVASVAALTVRPARVAAVPDPSGFDAAWMSSKYESDGPKAQYVDVKAVEPRLAYWLPARSSLTFSQTPTTLKQTDLRPVSAAPPPDFSEVTFRGIARLGDSSWPLFLRGTEIRDGLLGLRPKARAGSAVLGVSGPGAALTGSLVIPYSVDAGARLRIRVSGDPDLPGFPIAEITGPKTGVFSESMQKALGSLRERRFFIVLELQAGPGSSGVRVGPELRIETSMQWSHSAFGSPTGSASTLHYRDDGGQGARAVEVVVGGRPFPFATSGDAEPWAWEASSDDGVSQWRSSLSKRGAEARKVLSVPAGGPTAGCSLFTLLNGTPKDGDKPVFTAVFQVEGKEIAQVPVPNLDGIRWLRSPFDPSLLAGKREIGVRISLRADSELATGHLDLYGSTLDLGRSSFNGQRMDLSDDPGTQVGEFMIRARCGPEIVRAR